MEELCGFEVSSSQVSEATTLLDVELEKWRARPIPAISHLILDALWPGVPWQRCQFHLQQNAGSYVTKVEMRSEVAQDLRNIFQAPSREPKFGQSE